MVELIASILFIGSSAGAIAIAARKMPAQDQLPNIAHEIKFAGIFGFIRRWFAAKAKKNRYLKDFSWIDLAQKTLLKGKLIALKSENKINEYMVRLRQRAEDQKQKEEALLDNYWHDLKTMVKTRKPLGAKEFKQENSVLPEIAETSHGEPMVQRVAMPGQPSEKTSNHKKKRSSNHHNRRFKDPFRW